MIGTIGHSGYLTKTAELDWPADVRKQAQAVELLERALEALDPDCCLDLCADIQRFLNA